MTTITVISFEGSYHVSVCVEGVEYELGEYSSAGEAGTRMRRWVEGRGLSFGVDSAARLSEAQRLGGCCITFDVITQVEYDRLTEERRMGLGTACK